MIKRFKDSANCTDIFCKVREHVAAKCAMISCKLREPDTAKCAMITLFDTANCTIICTSNTAKYALVYSSSQYLQRDLVHEDLERPRGGCKRSGAAGSLGLAQVDAQDRVDQFTDI